MTDNEKMKHIIEKVGKYIELQRCADEDDCWKFCAFMEDKRFIRVLHIPKIKHKDEKSARIEALMILLIEGIAFVKYFKQIDSISDENYYKFIKEVGYEDIPYDTFINSIEEYRIKNYYGIFVSAFILTKFIKNDMLAVEIKFFGGYVMKHKYFCYIVEYYTGIIASHEYLTHYLKCFAEEIDIESVIDLEWMGDEEEIENNMDDTDVNIDSSVDVENVIGTDSNIKLDELTDDYLDDTIENEGDVVVGDAVDSLDEIKSFDVKIGDEELHEVELVLINALRVLQSELINTSSVEMFNQVSQKIIGINMVLGKMLVLRGNSSVDRIQVNMVEAYAIDYAVSKLMIKEKDKSQKKIYRKVEGVFSAQCRVDMDTRAKFKASMGSKSYSEFIDILYKNR